jgi:AraC family transcriptional regulator
MSLINAPIATADARVQQVLAYMHARLDQPLTVAELAGVALLSQYHFLRVFKRATGDTPHHYLVRLRVEEAKRLLHEGITVTEAARRCGFSSPAHLSAAFMRETGVRPSHYRDSPGRE